MSDNDFVDLIGQTVKELYLYGNGGFAFVCESGDILSYEQNQSCCENHYIEHISGLEFLLGYKILEVNTLDFWAPKSEHIFKYIKMAHEQNYEDSDDGDYIEKAFFTIKTEKGYFDFDARNNHNGYYGGISFNGPNYLKIKDLYYNSKLIKEDF